MLSHIEEIHALRRDLARTEHELRFLQLKRALVRYAKDYNPDQPRDDDGRWTSGGGDDGSDADDNTSGNPALGALGAGVIPVTWGHPDTLEKHYNDHGADFGATSPEDYANQANDFLQRGQAENLPAIEYPNGGEIGLYDPATNTFGLYNADSTTKTFYKPTSPTYFERETQGILARGGSIINPLSGEATGPENSGGGGGRGGLGLFGRPDGLIHPLDEMEE